MERNNHTLNRTGGGMPLVDQELLASASFHRERLALVTQGRHVSYRDLAELVVRISQNLLREGMNRGDRVLLSVRDSIDFILASYGIILAGAIVVPVADASGDEELRQAARYSKASIIVTDRQHQELRVESPCRVIVSDVLLRSLPGTGGPVDAGRTGWGGRVQDTGERDRTSADAVLLSLNRSAGAIRGTFYSHGDLCGGLVLSAGSPVDAHGFRELTLLVPSNILGMTRFHHVLRNGGTMIVETVKNPPMPTGQLALDYACSSLSSECSVLFPILDQFGSLLQTTGHLFRNVELDCQALTLRQKRRLIEAFPNARMTLFYGTEEIPRICALELNGAKRKIDSVGKPSSRVRIAIRDEDNRPLRRGQIGEVFILGGLTGTGAWPAADRMESAVPEENWVQTGNVGYLDREGHLHLLGTKEDCIHAAGGIIAPAEIEEQIRESYPGEEVCVVGIPDPAGAAAELAVLCYVAKNGKTIIPSELSSALAGRVDRYKIPRIVFRVNRFPDHDHESVRSLLRRQILEGAQSAESAVLTPAR